MPGYVPRRALIGGQVLDLFTPIQVAQPAAGAEFVYNQPGHAAYVLHSLALTLTTSATVGNRNIRLELAVGGLTVFRTMSNFNIPASTSAMAGFLQGVGAGSVLPAVTGPLPTGGLVIPAGAQLTSVTTNLQAGDQYSAIAGVGLELSLSSEADIDEERALEWLEDMAQRAALLAQLSGR